MFFWYHIFTKDLRDFFFESAMEWLNVAMLIWVAVVMDKQSKIGQNILVGLQKPVKNLTSKFVFLFWWIVMNEHFWQAFERLQILFLIRYIRLEWRLDFCFFWVILLKKTWGWASKRSSLRPLPLAQAQIGRLSFFQASDIRLRSSGFGMCS